MADPPPTWWPSTSWSRAAPGSAATLATRRNIVAAWLAGIIINLLSDGEWYDVAARDFGLMLGALALGRLASTYDPPLRRRM